MDNPINIYKSPGIQLASPASIHIVLTSLWLTFSPHKSISSGEEDLKQQDFVDIHLCKHGDHEAYRRIVEHHQGCISAMMWRFSRDPETHEELVQDVFIEAYFSLSSYRANAPFSHWLASIATRVGYRHWKRRRRERTHPTVPLQEWDQISRAAEGALPPNETADLLHNLLEQLPPRDRLVLTLRYLEDHSVEETARLTGWSQTMVKVQVWRARNKLRKLFEQIHGEESK